MMIVLRPMIVQDWCSVTFLVAAIGGQHQVEIGAGNLPLHVQLVEE